MKTTFFTLLKLLPILVIVLIVLMSSWKSEGNTMKADLFFNADTVQLLHAIQAKNTATAKSMIGQGAQLNTRGEEGITPLLWLIMQKDPAAVELALQLGADANFPAMVSINREGPKPAAPLAIIAGDGDDKIFSLLLQYGANPNAKNEATGHPAIFGTIGHDNWQQLNLLLQHGVDVNVTDRSNSNSALYAADLGKYDFVYKLLNEGASGSTPSTTGASVAWRVHLAIEKNTKNPAFKISKDTLATKELLIKQGVEFPPLSPKEVREQQANSERAH